MLTLKPTYNIAWAAIGQNFGNIDLQTICLACISAWFIFYFYKPCISEHTIVLGLIYITIPGSYIIIIGIRWKLYYYLYYWWEAQFPFASFLLNPTLFRYNVSGRYILDVRPWIKSEDSILVWYWWKVYYHPWKLHFHHRHQAKAVHTTMDPGSCIIITIAGRRCITSTNNTSTMFKLYSRLVLGSQSKNVKKILRALKVYWVQRAIKNPMAHFL